MRSNTLRLSLSATLCLTALAAVAQTKDAPKTSFPVAASNPDRTTASYADWILRCEMPAGSTTRICEVVQIVIPQGQTNPVAQVAIGRVGASEAMRLTVMLPVNVTIPVKPQVVSKVDRGKIEGVRSELSWQSCTAVGCFASTDISDETIASFGVQSDSGSLLFRDAAGRDIALQLSFKGLNQAVAALAKKE